MKTVHSLVLILAFLLLLSTESQSQIIASSLKPEVDTTYVDLKYNKWSLRLLGTYKHQNLFFSNVQGEKIKYVPNDRTSLGLGFSYKFLIIDLGIRLLLNRDEFTSRFDLQGEVALREHLIDLFVQRYQGFDKISSSGQDTFLPDMRSWVVGLNYLYNFNHDELTIRSVITGNRLQKKAAGTFLLGGFFSVQDLDSDTVLVTAADGNFNEYAEMRGSVLNNFGVLGGYAFITPIGKRFFLFGGLMPGVGLNFGKIQGNRSYDLKVNPMAKVNTRAAFGYIDSRWYGGVHYTSDYFIINLQHDNLFRYNIGKFKVVLGYKFNAKNSIIEDVLGE